MARVRGISGSTRYLLEGTKPINGKKLTTLEEFDNFYNNYEKILSDTEISIGSQQDAIILGLNSDELRLDKQLQEGISKRTKEVDESIDKLNNKIITSENFIKKLRYKSRYWIALSLRSHRIHRHFAGLSQELKDVRYRKAHAIKRKPHVIKLESQKIIDTYTFLENKISFLAGARGEEHVISVLSQLSDEYHVLNDVNLRFNPSIQWRERNESIKTTQIDHIVVGPTGIFLLETKNWKPWDIDKQSEKLVYQVKRANLALWYYLTKYHGKREGSIIRNVIVSLQIPRQTGRLDRYIDIITPDQLCDYITYRKRIFSLEVINQLVEIIPS